MRARYRKSESLTAHLNFSALVDDGLDLLGELVDLDWAPRREEEVLPIVSIHEYQSMSRSNERKQSSRDRSVNDPRWLIPCEKGQNWGRDLCFRWDLKLHFDCFRRFRILSDFFWNLAPNFLIWGRTVFQILPLDGFSNCRTYGMYFHFLTVEAFFLFSFSQLLVLALRRTSAFGIQQEK